MHRAGLAMLLGADPACIDGDVLVVGCRPRRVPDRLGGPRMAPVVDLFDETVEFAVAAVEQIILANQGLLEFACALEPLFAGSRPPVAQRADGSLPWPAWRTHRFHELVVGIGL